MKSLSEHLYHPTKGFYLKYIDWYKMQTNYGKDTLKSKFAISAIYTALKEQWYLDEKSAKLLALEIEDKGQIEE
jgi:hypothetical protein